MPREPNGEGNGDGKPQPPQPYTGPNYAGFVFELVSSSGKKPHTLSISTQENQNFDYLAAITGHWYNDPSDVKPFTGNITGNGDGIKCEWSAGGGTNFLQGTLTYNVGEKSGPTAGEIGPSAYLDGDVTHYDPDGDVSPGMGPGHVSGTGQKQPLAAP
jgi:hypothetical protein